MDLTGFTKIPDYPEYYINEKCEIYSAKVNRLLKSRPNTTGYWFITFTYHSRSIQLLVHRLMVHAFCGFDLNSTDEVHHKDGDINNNSIDNLEILTQQEHRDITILEQNKRNLRLTNLVCSCGNKIGPKNVSGICINCRRANGAQRRYTTNHTVVPPHYTKDDFNELFTRFGCNWIKLGGICSMSDNGLRKIFSKLK